ncbi:MAG: serine hydrolase [Candidatus Binatia bacterium]|nr:serine hydrolase [Candidatus Binatia bacterium]
MRKSTAFFALAPLLVLSCGGGSSGGGSSASPTEALEFPGSEWTESSPADQGMDAAGIEQAFDYAFQDGKETQGVVVVKNGYLIAERYSDGADASTLATSWSVAKSFTSATIGIAVDSGALEGIDLPVSDLITRWKGTAKEDITIRALLEMRSGLDWNEGESSTLYYIAEEDQVAAALDLDVVAPPHERFNYTSPNSMLLGEVVTAAVGRSQADFAQDRLFGPIGMSADWWLDGAGQTMGYCCIDATTRDFARFGLLFARGGEWQGEQVVSRAWVEESTRPLPGAEFYSHHWWTRTQPGLPTDLYSAQGLHTQRIYVVPSLDLVVARNGSYQRVGDEAVRAGTNVHVTQPPDQWSDADFLRPIVAAVKGAAESSQGPSSVSSALAERARAALESAGLL